MQLINFNSSNANFYITVDVHKKLKLFRKKGLFF